MFFDALRCRVNGPQLSAVLFVQLREFRDGTVNDRDVCPHAQCNAERAAADNTAAEHQNLGRCNTRYTAQKGAVATLMDLHVMRPCLD